MSVGPKKTGVNPRFKSSYVTLNDILEYIGEEKLEQVTQTLSVDGHGNKLWVSSFGKKAVTIPFPDVADAQQIGSALTYCRRYGLSLLFNLGAEDDDGNAATPPPAKRKSNKKSDEDFGF